MKLKPAFLLFISLTVSGIDAHTALSSEMPKILLLIGNGHEQNDPDFAFPNWHHDFHAEEIQSILDGIAEITATDDLSILNERDLQDFDLILNHSLFMTPSPAEFDAFFASIEGGLHYMTIHSGLVSFLNSERYAQLVGGKYIRGESVDEILVNTYDSWWGFDHFAQERHPITRSMANFRTRDELYTVDFNTDDLQVLARARNHPVMWTRRHGNGHIICLTLGHDLAALQSEGFRLLMQRSIQWLLGYPLIERVTDREFPVGTKKIVSFLDMKMITHHIEEAMLVFSVAANSNPEMVQASIGQDSHLVLEFTPNQTGTATLSISAESSNGLQHTFDVAVSIANQNRENLALRNGVTASASTSEDLTLIPAKAVDNDFQTRWSSSFEDDNWLCVDLGDSHLIDHIHIHWETAYALQYRIDVSHDSRSWVTVFTENYGDGEIDRIHLDPVNARFVRMQGLKRGSEWGYSIREIEIHGR